MRRLRLGNIQNANHSTEMHHGREHKVQAIEQKCILLGNTKRKPFCRNTSFSRSQNVNHSADMQSLGEHEITTAQQKCITLGNTKREPSVGNSVTQNVNRPAENQSPGQPSRIRKYPYRIIATWWRDEVWPKKTILK